MTKYQVFFGEAMIGSTQLEMHDPGMNIFSGHLEITEHYYAIRSIFKEFSSALDLDDDGRQSILDAYYRKRDALKLRIRCAGSEDIDINWIHIIDLSNDLQEIQIEVSSNVSLSQI